jgi:putative ABC transport system permease protein
MLLAEWRDDLQSAARGLLRARGFAATAVLTLALGIAGATVMFALVEGVLLRPLPVREQDRLLFAWQELRSSGFGRYPFTAREVELVAGASRVLESVAGVSYYDPSPYVAVENGVASPIVAAAVTGDFFSVVGAAPILGRALERGDDLTSAPNVLVISHGLWQRRYGGAPDVVGRGIVVGEQPFTIVGVMPPDFECPQGVSAWLTLAASASTVANPAFREGVRSQVTLIARLRPQASLDQARHELEALAPRLEVEAPSEAPRGLTPVVRSYADVVVGDVRPALMALFGAVALVLLIASANVANLLLLRGEARRTELALRAVLGARPGRVARLLLAESLLLALTAGALGFAVASLSLRAVVGLVPGGLPRVDSVRLDAGVALFAVAIAFLAAALAGLAPALAVARVDLIAHLRGGTRVTSGSGGRRAQRRLVAAQVALAVTLTAAAGLLTRSLLRLQAVETGLAKDRLVFVDLALPQATDEGGERHLQLLQALVARLEAAPGIAGATPVNCPPFADIGWDTPEFTAEGQDAARAAANPSLNLEAIHPNYFATLEVALVRGRAFTAGDGRGSPLVAIVSEDVAARTWPGANPIGRRLKMGGSGSDEPWRTLVGVARSTRYRELAAPRPTLYVPAPQFVVGAKMLALRTSSPLDVVARLARERVSAVDPQLRVTRIASFAELARAPLARPRFNAALVVVFGAAALMLTGIGLYAVMGAYVRQRFPEIGVRVALGASPSRVRWSVLADGLRLAATGAAIGLLGALVTGRVLRGLLFEVHPLDPLSLLGAPLVLIAAAALASYLPARQAALVDPTVVLRAE